MLHRLLFVAGMTVGVMTPLVWSAYVARPASNARSAPTVKIAKAAPRAQKPAPAAAQDITGAIAPAPVAMSAPKISAPVALPRPRPNPPPPANVPAAARPTQRLAVARAHPMRHRTASRFLPAVVDSYNGAHIITVCAALTLNEQLRAGCP